MPRLKRPSVTKAERLRDQELQALLTAYADRNAAENSPAQRAHLDASQTVDDLAFHEPDSFWRFLELAAASQVELEDLRDLGWGPLTWLLRRHPHDYAEKAAGAAAQDARMRSIVAGVDQDRVAPDVWRRLMAAVAD